MVCVLLLIHTPVKLKVGNDKNLHKYTRTSNNTIKSGVQIKRWLSIRQTKPCRFGKTKSTRQLTSLKRYAHKTETYQMRHVNSFIH